jgi:cell division protein FtsB
MDYQMNRRANNPAQEIRDATAPRQSFVEQLSAFFRRNLYWFLIAGFVLLLLQDIFGTHGVLAMRRSQAEASKIQREITKLDSENKKLQDHVKALKTDPSTMECIAREDFGLARPGELIFKTKPGPQQSCSAQ